MFAMSEPTKTPDTSTTDNLRDLATSAACTLVHDPELTLRDVAHFSTSPAWTLALAAQLQAWRTMYPARVAELLLAIRRDAGLVAEIVPLAQAGRGDHVALGGGREATFVGRLRGLVWLCYEPAELSEMCRNFDALVKSEPAKRARKTTRRVRTLCA
jgi:hypothetical protein